MRLKRKMSLLTPNILILNPTIVLKYGNRKTLGAYPCVTAQVVDETHDEEAEDSDMSFPTYRHILHVKVTSTDGTFVDDTIYKIDPEQVGYDWVSTPSTHSYMDPEKDQDKLNIFVMNSQPTTDDSVEMAIIYATDEWHAREILTTRFPNDPMLHISQENGGAKFYWYSSKHVTINQIGTANSGEESRVYLFRLNT